MAQHSVCKHCRAFITVSDILWQDGYCDDCWDLGVWGGACPECHRIPTQRRYCRRDDAP